MVSLLYTSESGRRYSAEDVVMIGQLAQSIYIANENARLHAEMNRAVALREDFVAIASHELRTPLSTLVLQLGRLKAGMSESADAESPSRSASWGAIERQVKRIESLVDTLLDVARSGAESIHLEREAFDLSALVTNVVDRFADEAARSHLVVSLDAEAAIVGRWDRLRIEQIVTNLLSNALKYGGGKSVDVSVASRDGKGVLSVRDRGIGIAAVDKARIFDRFERSVSVRKYSGLGLGLHIARSLAVAHGGDIEVDSVVGEGSTFVLTLPLGADRMSPAAAAPT